MAITQIFNRLFPRKTYHAHGSTTIPESVISFAPSITSDPSWEDPWFSAHFEGVSGRVCADNFLENLRSSQTVLDFGCGDGINSAGVASRICAQITGVDLTRAFDTLTDTLCKKGINYPKNLKFSQSKPGKKLPFGSESFDAVYSWSVFEHVADVQAVLREIFRILKPGGSLYVGSPTIA